MHTSYFSKYKGNNGVSIALFLPNYYNRPIECYPKLAPTRDIIYNYRNGFITEEEYKECYLSLLQYRGVTPHLVLDELGQDAVLLCFELSHRFCHRHIVSEWLRNAGIEISELE